MRKIKNIIVGAGILAVFSTVASAQTQVVTVTNVVTVLVTNIVTLTNMVVTAPVPASAPPPAAPVWKSSVSAGITLTRGNSDTMLFTADFLTEKKQPTDEYSLGAGIAYGNQNSQETVNNYKAFGQWNHLFSDRLYSYVRAEALRDIIADLDYRFTVGPGAGYYFIKTTNTFLATEAGFGYENQHLGSQYESFAALRLAERFEHKFNGRARVWQNVEFLPQVDKFDNYVVNFEIGVEAAISRSFSLKTCFDDTFNNRPAANRFKNDAKIVAGVSYKF